MPPRSNTAILGAAIVSFWALPPWLAFLESAWPRTHGMPSRAQRSASQVPGEETFDADDQVLTGGCHRLEKRFRPCLHMPVEQDLSRLVQDAEGPGSGRAGRGPPTTGVAWWRIAGGLRLVRW